MDSLDFASEKKLFNSSLVGTTYFTNLFITDLSDMFRTRQCLSVPKITQIGSAIFNMDSQICSVGMGCVALHVTVCNNSCTRLGCVVQCDVETYSHQNAYEYSHVQNADNNNDNALMQLIATF